MASSPNSRASLLAGLRTGGVRPSAPPIPPFIHDDLPVPFSPPHSLIAQNQHQNHAIQLQLLQLEMMRIQSQAIQAQQVQAELIAQAQAHRQQHQALPQQRERRSSFNPPATAAPHITAFDLRSATLSAQIRRANQTEQLKAQLGLSPAQPEDQVPMTAALGGRFGGRISNPSTNLSRFVMEESEEYLDPPPVAKVPLTNSVLANPSRSDQAANWRRGANGNANLSGSYRTPAVRVIPPQSDTQRSSPPLPITAKGRPQPLHISPAASQPLVMVTVVDTTEEDEAEVTSPSLGSVSVRSSSPITPPLPLSPREEATKKLYEGLGIGRSLPSASNLTFPTQHHTHTNNANTNHRMVSQPMRQPRGPPSGADELGPKNFATRIRRQAIGGLGILMGARERRESFIEAY